MVSKEELSLLSEEELEVLYKEKTEEYKKKLAKNRRIRSMLSKKVEEQENIVKALQTDLDEFIAGNPNIVKFAFDDSGGDAVLEDQIREEIEVMQKNISTFEKRKFELSKAYHELKIQFSGLEAQKTQIQEEINIIEGSLKRLVTEGSEEERLELAKLESKYKGMQNDIESLSQEIKELQTQFQLQKNG